MKAYLKKDTEKSNALWLIIEREGVPADTNPLMGVSRSEDSVGNVAFAFLEDEIGLIRDACDKFLNKNQKKT